MFDVVNS